MGVSARDREGLEYGHAVPAGHQILGGRQPAGPGADDGDAFFKAAFGLLRRNIGLFIDLVGDKSFQRRDRQRFIDQAPVAGVLTSMVADPTANSREWVVFLWYARLTASRFP